MPGIVRDILQNVRGMSALTAGLCLLPVGPPAVALPVHPPDMPDLRASACDLFRVSAVITAEAWDKQKVYVKTHSDIGIFFTLRTTVHCGTPVCPNWPSANCGRPACGGGKSQVAQLTGGATHRWRIHRFVSA